MSNEPMDIAAGAPASCWKKKGRGIAPALALFAGATILAARSAGAPPVAAPRPEGANDPKQPNRREIVLPQGSRIERGRNDLDSPDRPPLSVDRQIVRELQLADEQIAKKDYAEAIRHLQRVLDGPEDSWIEETDGREPRFRSAWDQATERIGRLPPAARVSYETEFGQVARRMVDDAKARGDMPALEEVVRRYFQTRAGYDAAYFCGNRLLDSSKPLAAAVQFERLRNSPGGLALEPALSIKAAYCWVRSGAPEKALPILTELKRRAPAGAVTIGGRSLRIFEREGDALAWLATAMGPVPAAVATMQEDWPYPGGRPSRNAETADVLPLSAPVWSQSIIRDSQFPVKDRFAEIESTLKNYEHELEDRGALTLGATQPIVVGRTAVFRTFARLRAVDVRDGRPLWDFADRDRHYDILAAAEYPVRAGHRLPISPESIEQDDLRLFLSARAFRDMTYGSLSTDGQRVFVIWEPGFIGQEDLKSSPQAEWVGARNQNVLAAIDLASGQLLWEVGGSRADRGRPLAGTFFFGPGLPLDGSLYCLGELDGEISLFRIDPATGQARWTQRLVLPLGRLPSFPLRRLAGANPSAAGGFLVCPTTAGVVVAVEPSTRSLRWEYRYRINVAEGLPDPRMLWVDEPLYTGNDESSRWLDASPTVTEACAILTPRDSDELHCLNLADGKLRWKRDRGTGLYLAGVLDGAVVVVGRSSVEALRLSDGTPVWEQPASIPMPAGRGYRTGRLYHLPLTTGEFATIDLSKGRVLTRSRFRAGLDPGNLVAAGGTVLMQSARSLDGFPPTAEQEALIAGRLEKKADDPDALAARGELRLHRAQTQAGLDDLLRALQARPDARVRELAVATVLENLRFDFAHNRESAARIETLIAEPSHRFEFHRLMAAGLEQSGDLAGAYEHVLSLARDESLDQSLVAASESLRVRPAQFVAPYLRDLYAKAVDGPRDRLRQTTDAWVAKLVSARNPDGLRRGIAALCELDAQQPLRRALIEALSDKTEGERSELVRQLLALRGSQSPDVAGTATARLAGLFIPRGRAAEGLALLSDLDAKYASVKCEGDKTGHQLAERWRSDPAVKEAAARQATWPTTHLTVRRREEEQPAHAVNALPFDPGGSPLFRRWRFESRRASEGNFALVAIDADGTMRWKLELDSAHLGDGAQGDMPLAVRAHGHLLQVAMHRRFVMMDALDGNGPPRILWSRELYDRRWSPSSPRPDNSLTGLITDDCVYYQVGSVLTCSDAVTGRVVWERRNVPTSYVLQGDRDYLVAINRNEPNDPSGLVLHAATGVEVFSGSLGLPGPLLNNWRGRRVAAMAVQPGQIALSLVDPVQRKAEWTRTYTAPAWFVPIDDEVFGVLDSDLRLHVHSFDTGDVVLEMPIERTGNPPQIVVRRARDGYLVVNLGGVYRSSGLRGPLRPASNGRIASIDAKTGKPAWILPMAIMQPPVDQPDEAPVVVLVRPLRRVDAMRGGVEVMLSVVDARNGRVLYEGREFTAPERVRVRLEPQSHAVIVTADRCRLEITPTDVPLSSPPPIIPVEAPRPSRRD